MLNTNIDVITTIYDTAKQMDIHMKYLDVMIH